MIAGIDVSNHQAFIDWPSVARDGVQFAFIKATEGTTYQDPYFGRNWQQCKDAGIARGAYHFARPSRNDAHAEAQAFVEFVQRSGGFAPGDVVALDLEDEDATGDLSEWALDWLDRVTNLAGARPLLYSRTDYLVAHGCANHEDLAGYGLWLADWRGARPEPAPGWPFWAVWQYTDRGTVAGISGPVDRNWFNGASVEQFRRYGVPAVAPAAPTNWQEAAKGWQTRAEGAEALLATVRAELVAARYRLESAGSALRANGDELLAGARSLGAVIGQLSDITDNTEVDGEPN